MTCLCLPGSQVRFETAYTGGRATAATAEEWAESDSLPTFCHSPFASRR